MTDEEQITVEDVFLALKDIYEAAPDLMEYILTCYPLEEFIYISPDLCQHLEALKKS